MQAINLVPAEERRGAGGVGGRSSGAAYALLGILGLLVLIVAANATLGRSVEEKRAERATVEQQVDAAEARATGLAAFTRFTAESAKRKQTVAALAVGRFDWSHAMTELARVIPANVWLTGLQGTASPGVTLKESAAVGTSGLRGALPVPAVELAGCTTSQRSVARMLTRMRLIDGVTRASLQSAVKPDVAAGGDTSGGECGPGKAPYPKFELVVFFDPEAGAVPTQARGVRGSVVPAGTAPGGPTPAPPIGSTP